MSTFHPFEVVGRGSETHLQVNENLIKRITEPVRAEDRINVVN